LLLIIHISDFSPAPSPSRDLIALDMSEHLTIQRRVIHKDVSYTSFLEFLKFIYTGQSRVKRCKLSEFVKIAHLCNFGEIENVLAREYDPIDEEVATTEEDGYIVLNEKPHYCALKRFVNNSEFSDVTFILEDNSVIHSHKIILSSRSCFFDCMFNSGMAESRQKEIKLLDIMQTIFCNVLEFLYTGDCDITTDNVEELLIASNRFTVTQLKLKCEYFIQDHLTVHNAAYYLELSDRHQAAELRSAALMITVRNFEEVSKTFTIYPLSKELLDEIQQKMKPDILCVEHFYTINKNLLPKKGEELYSAAYRKNSISKKNCLYTL